MTIRRAFDEAAGRIICYFSPEADNDVKRQKQIGLIFRIISIALATLSALALIDAIAIGSLGGIASYGVATYLYYELYIVASNMVNNSTKDLGATAIDIFTNPTKIFQLDCDRITDGNVVMATIFRFVSQTIEPFVWRRILDS